MTALVLDDRDSWPLTFSFVLVRASLERVQRAVVGRTRGRAIAAQHFDVVSLAEAVDHVTHLSIRRDVALLMSTTFGWTAYFDNGPHGSDATTMVGYLVGGLAEEAVVVGHTPAFAPLDGFPFGGALFSYYEPAPARERRGLAAWQDGKKWYFETHGEPLVGERTDAYLARLARIADAGHRDV